MRRSCAYLTLLPFLTLGGTLIWCGSPPVYNEATQAAPVTELAQKVPPTTSPGSSALEVVGSLRKAEGKAMVVSLQAITSRSTQDLWGNPTSIPGDLTVEQQAQKRAAAVSKLSKHINGDIKAKDELKTSLQHWLGAIGQHLAGLVQRVRALGDKVDGDLAEACREMQLALQEQPSSTTAEQVAAAHASIGSPVWAAAQEQEILRIAALLRAVSVVEGPTGAGGIGDALSEVSFGLACGGRYAYYVSALSADIELCAIRRDTGNGVPWTREATGRTPETSHRPSSTVVDDPELLPAARASGDSPDWSSAWLRLVRYIVDHGDAVIGELSHSAEQDAVLPILSDPEMAAGLAQQLEETWVLLVDVTRSGDVQRMPRLYAALSDSLQRLRICPEVLPMARQGLVAAAQLTLGNLLDPFGYAPSTAQEWLFPALLVEHGGPYVGHLPVEAVAHQVWQHGAVNGQPVFNSGGAADVTDIHDVMPVEALPGLPQEQYVVSPSSLPWNMMWIPVDLRPEGFLCRTGAGWFVPSAYIMLLPRGDAFQVWPVHQIQATIHSQPDSLPVSLTLEDRFTVSVGTSGVGEVAYHDLSGDNAVVIADTGLCYVRVPSYADHLSIRTAALGQFESSPRPGTSITHFAR
ncbi:unnamed protein product, partial [Symbiodinium necroappetens]